MYTYLDILFLKQYPIKHNVRYKFKKKYHLMFLGNWYFVVVHNTYSYKKFSSIIIINIVYNVLEIKVGSDFYFKVNKIIVVFHR